ncbi:MAG TPA: manganese-binding transcriptional regulator MntR [Caulobacteraceae bacterium]
MRADTAGEGKRVAGDDSGDSPGAAEGDPQAAIFRLTRRARQSEVAEDYVELIGELIAATGEARVVDIARRLGVSHATVNKTLARLARDGLVLTRPYRAVFLTKEGRRIAEWSRERHEVVVRFLRAIGVGEAAACADAEGIEHHVSEETLAAFRKVIETAGGGLSATGEP